MDTYEEWRDWAIKELHPSASAWIAVVNDVTSLGTELAELRKDKARLDWLDAEVVSISQEASYRYIRRRFKTGKDYLKCQYSTLRQAIDAAMGEEVEG